MRVPGLSDRHVSRTLLPMIPLKRFVGGFVGFVLFSVQASIAQTESRPATQPVQEIRLTPEQELAKKNAIAAIPTYWFVDTHPYTIETCTVTKAADSFAAIGEPILVGLLLDYQDSSGAKLKRGIAFTVSADGKKLSCRANVTIDGLTPSERAKRNVLKFFPKNIQVLDCTVTVSDPEWHIDPPISISAIIRYNGPQGWTKKIIVFHADATGETVMPIGDLP